MKTKNIILKSVHHNFYRKKSNSSIFSFKNSIETITAIENLDLTVYKNEILCLVGPSGCGKSTIINLIAGFLHPTRGEVLFLPNSIQSPDKRCGVVFQTDSVFPWKTVKDNVLFGIDNKLDKMQKNLMAKDFIRKVGLQNFENSWPKELSGGMRKRVDLARAYAANPDILLLDEPFGTLDVLTKEEMQVLLLNFWWEQNKTILVVTHDPEEAVFLGHRVAIISHRPGRVVKIMEIPFTMPRSPNLKLDPDFIILRKNIVKGLQKNATKL